MQIQQLVLGVLFLLLGLMSIRFWWRARDKPSLFVLLMFLPIAIVEIWAVVWMIHMPTDADRNSLFYQLSSRLLIGMILIYPWALYQLSSFTRNRQSKIGQLGAGILTFALVVFVLFVQWPTPPISDGLMAVLNVYRVLFIVQFLTLSIAGAVKLIRAGWHQPNNVRIRLRLMATAALLLSLALAMSQMSGTATTRADWAQGVYFVSGVLSCILFMICLNPPRVLRVNWSYKAIRDVREVIRDIMVADTRSDAVAMALPIMTEVVGSQIAVGYDVNGEVLAQYPSDAEIELPSKPTGLTHTIVIPMETEGQVVLVTNALWPFVGEEEMDLLEFVGSAVGLALNRRRLDDANAQLRIQSAVERSLRMQASELERANRELNEFVAVASHDLQTPVRNIIDNVEFLNEDLDDERQLSTEARQDLQYIQEGAHRVKALIDGLLHYTRVDAVGAVDASVVELEQVVEQVKISMETTFTDTGTTVSIEPLPRVMGNYSELGEVFANLFDNAIKYRSPEAAPHIKVSSQIHSEGMVDIIVTDNGIGIPAEYRDRVFDMFKRLHSHDEIPGTGIGLAVCRKIVERMGGQISFEEPDDNIGARVCVTLPTSQRGHLGKVA